ncbi:hypothetical protein [Nocardioides bruguierae]|uniref:Sulfotransferase family protein n=1 Tax=Nocardioides bruguierae TaxID=2945102 RepID=A0A9X2D720_9ACTN|nr:hypothetical protein [Nocardioides bruguierae]MCM0619349.1 hypothetical protein [Nocardioides bruguierae]
MAERVVLHVGLMKSGTTYLQGLLERNQERLLGHGVLFPGPTWDVQARAVNDLLGLTHCEPGDWARTRDALLAHPGTSLLSMEFLANLGAPGIRGLVAELAPAPVEVVITARDLGRGVPALWQESCKNRRTWTWEEYVEGVRTGEDRPGPGRHFWRRAAYGRIARRWATEVGADRVTVVVVPPPGAGPTALWDRFREASGLPADDWLPPARANESLGPAQALLMRRLNEGAGDLGGEQYRQRFKALAKHTLGEQDEAGRIGFTVPPWLHARSREEVGTLEAAGIRVVGDLADLAPLDTPGTDPTEVPVGDVLAAGVRALDTLLREGDDAVRPAAERSGTEGVHRWAPRRPGGDRPRP